METTVLVLTEQQRACQRELANELRKTIRRLVGKHPGVWHSETLKELYSIAEIISDLEQEGLRPHIYAAWQPPLFDEIADKKGKSRGKR